MSAKLKVEFSPPRNGWIQLTLGSGDQGLTIPVSYTPFDSLEEIASAVASFLEGGRQAVARLNCEPEEYEVVFEPGARSRELRVRVVCYPRGRRARSAVEAALVHEGDAIQIGRTFWRAFRKLESRFDVHHWIHDFPSRTVRSLGSLTAGARAR
jgi:hypothetical protein